MKKSVVLFLMTLLTPALVRGQEAQPKSGGHGYAFIAPGAATTFACRACTFGTIHVGGGAEAIFYKGLGIGAELGYLVPLRDVGSGLGLASVNGLYIFRGKARSKLEPFVTAGVTLAFASGAAAGGINFGGGVQYWLQKRMGLRIEFRDHVPSQSFDSHLFEGRIGLAFR